MDCHVNVDITLTVSIFIYLYKCLYKGPDHTQYMIVDPSKDHINEIKNVINARYDLASTAAWKIFVFGITT